MATDIYGDSNLVQYEYGGNTWLELKNIIALSENGGYSDYTSKTRGFMVIPGSGLEAVKCYCDIRVSIRVNQDLDAYIKICPGNSILGTGYSGFYHPRVNNYGSSELYPAMFVLAPFDYTLIAHTGETAIRLCTPGSTHNSHSYMFSDYGHDMIYAENNYNYGVTILRKYSGTGYPYFGRSFYYNGGSLSYGRHPFVWEVGYGWNVDSVGRGDGSSGVADRWETNSATGEQQLTDKWKASSGWVYIGNLERNFSWSEDKENFDGWVYLCGTGYYPNSAYDDGVVAVPYKVTVPGLKRLLNYYPWAVKKLSGAYGNDYYSCNRSGGHLKSKESDGSWGDRKNRYNSNASA